MKKPVGVFKTCVLPVQVLTYLFVSCDRSAALCSSAVERATYYRAPFLAHVCPTSLGAVFNLSALVS